MLKVYGSMLCPDCVKCREDLSKAGVEYEYLDFSDSLKNLKDFLTIRDGSSLFEEIRSAGKIGIPCVVTEDGKVSLTWEGFEN